MKKKWYHISDEWMAKQYIFIPIGMAFMILAFTIHGDFPDRWVPILSIITLSLLYAGILMLAYGIYFGVILWLRAHNTA